MTAMTLLGDIAHARAGDKGDTSILMVAPYQAQDYAMLLRTVTLRALAAHFANVEPGNVSIHRSDGLRAVTIVLRHQLRGGVTRATTVDPHGKAVSGHLLEMPVDVGLVDDQRR